MSRYRWDLPVTFAQKYVHAMKILNDWRLVIMMSVTLGLAPFFPEPHIVGKIRWIMGGAVGMKLIDWGDAIFHGLPWLLLIRLVLLKMKSIINEKIVNRNPNA